MSDCLHFPLTVWLIFMVTITFYAAVFVFLQNGVQFVHQRYNISEKNSSFMMSLPYTVSALFCPVFGALVDGAGRAVLWIILATSALAAIQLSFALWLDFSPTVGVVGMGMCYSVCASALWPCISIVVEDKRLGMAYGLMTAFQNLGMALFPIIISPLLPDADRTSADTTMEEFIEMYRDVLMVFGYLACASTGFSILLLLADLREGGWLNASASALQARDILRARRSCEAFSTVPALYTHHVHSRNKYLSRLGIRPRGGPRLQNEVLDRGPATCFAGPNLAGSDYDPSLASVPCLPYSPLACPHFCSSLSFSLPPMDRLLRGPFSASVRASKRRAAAGCFAARAQRRTRCDASREMCVITWANAVAWYRYAHTTMIHPFMSPRSALPTTRSDDAAASV
jgi:hypothetical protein